MAEQLTPLLTVADVSKLLAYSVNATKRIPPSELPFVRLGTRGDRRYRPEDVAAYVERRRVES